MNIRKWLCRLLHCCKSPSQPPTPNSPYQLVFWLSDYPFLKFTGDNIIMKVIQPGQRANFAVTPRGRISQNPVAIDGPVRVSVDDERVNAVVNEDGLSGYFELPIDTQIDTVTAVTATVEFDAQQGEGENTQTLTGAMLIGPEEAGANASTFEISDPIDSPTDTGGDQGVG